jgi:hypothetical protein
MEQVLLEKLIVVRLAEKIPVSYTFRACIHSVHSPSEDRVLHRFNAVHIP